MKKLLLALALCVSALSVLAQVATPSRSDFEEKFYDEVFDKQYDTALATLAEWEAAYPDDAQLWPARFNYHLNKARQDMLCLSNDTLPETDGEYIVFSEENSDTPVGSIYGMVTWDEEEFGKAIEAIETGIKEHPDRLDYRFGEVSAYRYRELYDKAIDILLATAQRDATEHPKWLWTNNAVADQDVLTGICGVASTLFYDGNLDEAFNRLVDGASKYYPDNFMIVNLQALSKMGAGDYAAAIPILEKALALNPGDDVIISNIAYCRMQMGESKEALRLYKQLLDSPTVDDDIRAYSEEMVTALSGQE